MPEDVAEAGRGEVLWRPAATARDTTRVGRYLTWLERTRGLSFDGYADLWQWSVDDLAGFWTSVWEHFDLRSHAPRGPAIEHPAMPGTRWFPGAALNYAEHALAATGDATAVVSRSQTRGPRDLTFGELRDEVARVRAALLRLGVRRGDRVVAYMPTIPETLVAFLACASLGAVWSSCAPEFGVRSVVDRVRQIEPAVLLAVDGYRFGSAAVDRREEVARVRAALPSLRATVVLRYLGDAPGPSWAQPWESLLEDGGPLTFDPVPFDHPLYILYSSGTTGLPKPIVHGHGGILLEHVKSLALHHDLGPGDRFFWFTTTGWMMWNLLVSGLLVESSVVLFDGSPSSPDLGELWRLAEEAGVTYLGTSAPFLMACRKAGIRPRELARLDALRTVGSTGAPLPAAGFRWVRDAVGEGVQTASVSGGTDVCTAFVGGSPLVPVRAGEISCRCLGARVEAFDAQGRPVVGEQGELVLTAPMPSMPVGFWGDADGSRYRAAYYAAYPGVWRHGDWVTILPDGACVISGRSDSTLNRGGVRIGTSEFYSVVESMPDIVDSLVVHLEAEDASTAGELVLFVVLAPGVADDDGLRGRVAAELRTQLSPRHVPDRIVAVAAVPRTLSGKKLEVPVKRILRGVPPDEAASRDALADPAALDAIVAYAAATASEPGGQGRREGGPAV